jgi:hypothetical protein
VAPALNSLSSNDRLIVASGKTPTISPARSAATAARNEFAPASRSTGMCRMPRISGPDTRWSKTSCLAMNRTSRPAGRAASPA